MYINVSLSAAPKLALVPASRYYCDVNWSNHNVKHRFIRIQMGVHDFKLKKVPFPTLNKVNINVSRSAAPELALMPASRYNCDTK